MFVHRICNEILVVVVVLGGEGGKTPSLPFLTIGLGKQGAFTQMVFFFFLVTTSSGCLFSWHLSNTNIHLYIKSLFKLSFLPLLHRPTTSQPLLSIFVCQWWAQNATFIELSFGYFLGGMFLSNHEELSTLSSKQFHYILLQPFVVL